MNHAKTLTLFIMSFFLLKGCSFKPDIIKQRRFHDRVVACSADFSRETGATLEAAYEKSIMKGDAGVNFKE